MNCPACGHEMRLVSTHEDGTRTYGCPYVQCRARVLLPPEPAVPPATSVSPANDAAAMLRRIDEIDRGIRVLQADKVDNTKALTELHRQIQEIKDRLDDREDLLAEDRR